MIVTIPAEQAVDEELIQVIREDLASGIVYKIQFRDRSYVIVRTHEDYSNFLNDIIP